MFSKVLVTHGFQKEKSNEPFVELFTPEIFDSFIKISIKLVRLNVGFRLGLISSSSHDVILVSLLLTVIRSQTWLWCFYCSIRNSMPGGIFCGKLFILTWQIHSNVTFQIICNFWLFANHGTKI